MKEYRLKAWPELPAAFRHTSYRRLLSELSQRHVSESDLQGRGLSRRQLRGLIRFLDTVRALDTRVRIPPVVAPRTRPTWLSLAFWRRLLRAA